jgi:hypothetical protein
VRDGEVIGCVVFELNVNIATGCYGPNDETSSTTPEDHLQPTAFNYNRASVKLLGMNSVRILCFGDSLTWGWTKFGEGAHPYANALVSALEKRMPTTTISADVQGAPGDQVVSPPGGFVPRMDILCGCFTIKNLAHCVELLPGVGTTQTPGGV